MDEYIERKALRNAVESIDWYSVLEGKLTTGADSENALYKANDIYLAIDNAPTADVAPVRHGRCPVCSGNAVLTQDCDNGYSLEIDAEQAEASLWYGDACLAVFNIDFCPNCGARMDLEVTNDA